MSEKIRVLVGCEIPGFSGEVDLFSIDEELNSYTKTIMSFLNINDLNDWSILISVVLRSTNGIGIYKRIKRYPSDKEFEISISVTVPDDKQAVYGFYGVREGFYLPMDETKFYFLHPNFEEYNSLQDYILSSAKNAIALSFQHGFTCNGKKIKSQDN